MRTYARIRITRRRCEKWKLSGLPFADPKCLSAYWHGLLAASACTVVLSDSPEEGYLIKRLSSDGRQSPIGEPYFDYFWVSVPGGKHREMVAFYPAASEHVYAALRKARGGPVYASIECIED